MEQCSNWKKVKGLNWYTQRHWKRWYFGCDWTSFHREWSSPSATRSFLLGFYFGPFSLHFRRNWKPNIQKTPVILNDGEVEGDEE